MGHFRHSFAVVNTSLKSCIMKFLLVALCSLAMASAIVVEICDPDITEAHFDNLDIAVDPDPIVVEVGKQVGLHFAIDLLTQMNGGTVKIDIVSGILPVPCLEVEGHKVGSCEYTTEELVPSANSVRPSATAKISYLLVKLVLFQPCQDTMEVSMVAMISSILTSQKSQTSFFNS